MSYGYNYGPEWYDSIQVLEGDDTIQLVFIRTKGNKTKVISIPKAEAREMAGVILA